MPSPNTTLLNSIAVAVGGVGGHEYNLDALNAIATKLLGSTQTFTRNLDALNAIAGHYIGSAQSFTTNIAAMNAIAGDLGGLSTSILSVDALAQWLAKAVFNPTSISGLRLWLKADSLTLNDGDPVETWTDSGAGGNNATQATVSKRPVFKTNIVNGKPVVRFDGVDDVLQTANFGLAIPFELYTVFVERSVAATRRLMGGRTSFVGVLDRNGTNLRIFGDSLVLNFADTDLAAKLIRARFLTTGGAIAKNGGTEATGTGAQSVAPGGWTLGSSGDFTSYGPIDVAECLLYNSPVSTTDRASLESYLGAKYGITIP